MAQQQQEEYDPLEDALRLAGVPPLEDEEQKPEEQKPEEQKPEEQKPEEQKPEEQKPEEQKPEEQKPEEQKPEEPKPAADEDDEGKDREEVFQRVLSQKRKATKRYQKAEARIAELEAKLAGSDGGKTPDDDANIPDDVKAEIAAYREDFGDEIADKMLALAKKANAPAAQPAPAADADDVEAARPGHSPTDEDPAQADFQQEVLRIVEETELGVWRDRADKTAWNLAKTVAAEFDENPEKRRLTTEAFYADVIKETRSRLRQQAQAVADKAPTPTAQPSLSSTPAGNEQPMSLEKEMARLLLKDPEAYTKRYDAMPVDQQQRIDSYLDSL